MHWRIKAAIQTVLGHVPSGERLHFHLQRTFGGLRNFDREITAKIDDWHIMVGHLRNAGITIQGLRMLEVGSGWYPTLPFAYYLGGAARVVTIDLNRHMRADLTRMCAERLGAHLPLIAEACGVSEEDARRRHRRLLGGLVGCDVQSATDGVVEYHAPGDATRSELPDHSIDVVFSNSVLEHVPPDVVDALYRESRRILASRGIMFHSVNCGDHYAYVDRSISQLNYLRYSDEDWRKWNNDFLYQNRMRADEFVARARQAGFEVELDTAKPHPRRLEELKAVPVHAQFAGIPPERLCITSVDFIARQPAKAATATDAASTSGNGRQVG
jgi:SAM-dependent methyltransferase